MNIFDFEADCEKEVTDIICKGENVRIERIISTGQSSPEGFWYDQHEDEWVLLLSGSAVLRFEDGDITLKAGDYILIPAHKRHRVESTSFDPPCVWVCVFGNFN